MIVRLVAELERLAGRLDRLASWVERQADELDVMLELRAARKRRARA